MKIQEAIKYFVKRTRFPINKEHCETALKALYKANKLKPLLYDEHYFKCPFCEWDLAIAEDDIHIYEETPPNYCKRCGQALDWSDHQTEKGGESDG